MCQKETASRSAGAQVGEDDLSQFRSVSTHHGHIASVIKAVAVFRRGCCSSAFAESEAGLLLEDLKPTAFGLSLNQRVLAGEISIEQADTELRAQYAPAFSRTA